MESTREFRSHARLIERIKSILATRRLTLHQVSEQSVALFGRSSPYFLPHNLYYELRRGDFSPSLFQLFAFSQISRYRLSGWLRVFGFDLEEIPRLQIQLPAERTIVLDSSLYNLNVQIPWFRGLKSQPSTSSVLPLSQLLDWAEPRILGSLPTAADKRFLYLRIGEADAIAFPDLLAGSIVRINQAVLNSDLPNRIGEVSKRLFLVEHRHGLCCCHIRRVAEGRFGLVSSYLSYPNVEYSIPEDATLLGVADVEIRNVYAPKEPKIVIDPVKSDETEVIPSAEPRLGSLLREARLKLALSFRAASARTRKLADVLRDERYFASPGALSDYESKNVPPRHFQKVISFCVVYAIPFHEIVNAMGLRLQEAGYQSIAEPWIGDTVVSTFRVNPKISDSGESDILERLITDLEEIPFFLRGSLVRLSGIPNLSLRDFFWVGGIRNELHPDLRRALLVVVNRHKKRPNGSRSRPLWQQPLFVVLKRDGEYMCAHCSIEKKNIVLHSYAGGVHSVERFHARNIEVIGRIVAVVRKLS